MDEITQQARTVGSVNTTYFRENVDGTVVHVGTNLDVAGVGNSLHAALVGHPTPMPAGTPSRFASGKAASLMIGGGGATRVSYDFVFTRSWLMNLRNNFADNIRDWCESLRLMSRGS